MEPKRSPSLFAEWAAVTCLSGALERRCFCTTNEGPLYPNLYVWLVGFPAIGKGLSIGPIRQLWGGCKNLRLGSTSITGKGLVDELVSGIGEVDVEAQTFDHYCSLLIGITEFGTFLQQYDLSLVNILTDLYDCLDEFHDRTRGLGLIKVTKPHLVILAGCTPGYISSTFPREAFDMGFTSRTIMVWSEEVKKTTVFGEQRKTDIAFADLQADLRRISRLRGEFDITPDAKLVVEDWFASGMQPVPKHPRLLHYSGRRLVHMLKLAMCFSVSDSDTLVLTDDHIISALDLLLRTEEQMPRIFAAMQNTDFVHNMHEIQVGIVALANTREAGRMSKEDIVVYLSTQMDYYKVLPFIKVLEESGVLFEDPSERGTYSIEPTRYH